MRFQRRSKCALAVLSIVMGSVLLLGCGDSGSDSKLTFEVPKNAKPEEISPGKPAKPPVYRKSSRLPGPPPFNPNAPGQAK